eukprot:1230922-Rhodomonas_salina.1
MQRSYKYYKGSTSVEFLRRHDPALFLSTARVPKPEGPTIQVSGRISSHLPVHEFIGTYPDTMDVSTRRRYSESGRFKLQDLGYSTRVGGYGFRSTWLRKP